jgi:hypothetical protein
MTGVHRALDSHSVRLKQMHLHFNFQRNYKVRVT